MIRPEFFYAQCQSAPPELDSEPMFHLAGIGDVQLCTGEDGRIIRADFSGGQIWRDWRGIAVLARAQPDLKTPALVVSQLRGGRLCFHILSPGPEDESEAVYRLLTGLAGRLKESGLAGG